ncbi:MAG: hypothetical protein KGL13_00740 [Gammaproteobacteria bacterium]|nr:hypothetical protein [Gammaproteobacteria bacterium]
MRHYFLYGVAIVVATVIAFYLHVWLVNTIDPYVSKIMSQGHYMITSPRNSMYITAIAGVTSLITIGSVLLLFLLIEPKLPRTSPILQGALLAILILLIDGQLIRQPLMNWLIGNPPLVVLLELSKVWIPRFAMCILLTSIVRWRRLVSAGAL